ncbi:DoxX family protein [Sungkyunkwania multivorans]|uniref:DoxX family protein n=1 Tax=Sungkyunkwania multivorans TaxID=1173618 RepID=A0ABW3CZQ5_9FLAO
MEKALSNITEILLLLFLIITFLQSALDKIFDWKGNVDWLKGHFSKTFFQNYVPLALFKVLVVELVAGVVCLIGIFKLIMEGEKSVALYGAILSCIALLMLLFGQRVAKDYDGARTIAIYFAPAIFTVFLLAR